MKKMLTLLLMCFGMLAFQAKAQYPSVTVKNATGCDVYYLLYGSKKGSCSIVAKSGTLFIAAGATVTFANPTVVPIPGLTPSDNIIGAVVYNKNPNLCADIPFDQRTVLNPCAGAPQVDQINVYNDFCKFCSLVKIQWFVSGSTQILYLL